MKRSVPQDCPHSRCQWQVQVVTCASEQPVINSSPQDPFLRVDHFLEGLTECRKAVFLRDNSLQRIVKEMNAQRRGTWDKVWKTAKHRSSCPHAVWGGTLSKNVWLHSSSPNLELSKPHTLGIFKEALLHRHDFFSWGKYFFPASLGYN